MTRDTHIDETYNRTDPRRTFDEIRENVEKATSQEELSELYKKTAYMITLTHASPVVETSDQKIRSRREMTEKEFARTVHLLNERAKKLGVEADYDEDWEKLATHGYQSEDENLEAQDTAEIIREYKEQG
jgi:hypothetical protein